MQILFILILVVSLSLVKPQNPKDAYIINYKNDNIGVGGYSFSFRTSNYIEREETGKIVNEGKEDEHLVVKGRYSYVDDNQQTYIVEYTADENGFQSKTSRLVITAPKMQGLVGAELMGSLIGGGIG